MQLLGCRKGTTMSSVAKRNIKLGTVFAVGAVGAVALGGSIVSGALFNDTDTARVDINAATVVLSVNDNDNQGVIDLDFNNLKPGQTLSEKITVTNDGSIVGVGTLGSNFTNATPPANVDYSKLSVGVRPDAGVVSPLSSTQAAAVGSTLTPVTQLPANWDLGAIKPGQTKTFWVDVKLDSSAGNEYQGLHFGGNIPVTLTQQ